MSARLAGAAVARKNISFDASELTADTTPKPSRGHLAVVWRNPRSNDLVPTGSVGLGEVRPYGYLLTALAFLETDLGLHAHSPNSSPGTPLTTGDIWGTSQPVNYGYQPMTPTADYWGIGQLQNASPGSVLISPNLKDMYPFASYVPDRFYNASPNTVLTSADLEDMYQIASYAPNTAILVTNDPLQSGCIEVPAGNLRDRSADRKFRAVFDRATDERFEDGTESQFAKDLESLVRTVGSDSTDIPGNLLEDGSTSPEVLAEAMRWIGRTEGMLSRKSKFSLLGIGLSSKSTLVRDSAALGLATIDDPAAIPLSSARSNLRKTLN